MYSKFEGLESEKQQRILNAAMKVFAAKGYDHASTNQIVEDAGIAKGLLFHYFKNKKQLFLYLYDHCIELVIQEVSSRVGLEDKDFFTRLNNAQLAKFELMRMHPDIMDFLKTAYLEDSAVVRHDLDERNRDLMLISFRKQFEDIDTSVFREDLDIGKVINTIAWAFEGFANTYFNKMKFSESYVLDYDVVNAEAKEYEEFLKKCFYK